MVADALVTEKIEKEWPRSQEPQDIYGRGFLSAAEGSRPKSQVPEGFSVEGKGLKQEHVTVDEKEVGEAGGSAEYMEIFYPADLAECNEENIRRVEEMWPKFFGGEECPHDFADFRDSSLNYETALRELEDKFLLKLSSNKIGVDVLRTNGVDVDFDLKVKPNEYISRVLEKLGGDGFLEDIWRNCRVITLKKPFDEDSDWVIILQAWNGDWNDGKGDWKKFALKLSDFERALIVDKDRHVKLPALQTGSVAEQTKFKAALGKIKMGGSSISDAALFVEDWPGKKESK